MGVYPPPKLGHPRRHYVPDGSWAPIVMAQGVDAVGAGFVKSMARPGGNTTGFTQFEYALAAKWVEMLREIAQHTLRRSAR
jgi:ABC-type uncharacterized transport system substrate-binding protein